MFWRVAGCCEVDHDPDMRKHWARGFLRPPPVTTLSVLCAAFLTFGCWANSASASQLIDRNPTSPTLQLNAKGEALLTYRAHGQLRHVLAWGGINARAPSAGLPQVAFSLDYTGGYGKYFKNNATARALAAEYRKIRGSAGATSSPIAAKLRQLQKAADLHWKTAFHGGCGHYTGPTIPWPVIECTASDGSNWAIQEWQRELPDYGVTPTAAQNVEELRLSHWTGPLPQLEVHTDWAYGGQYDHLFGTLTYLGQPAFGFRSTKTGNPLDNFGRNIYIDTFNSAYGAGWRRENSALTHKNTGAFCYAFVPQAGHPAGNGSRYRISVIGPGVTPDITWEGPTPGPYDAAADQTANAQIAALHDKICQPN
jgi:hypothetical protein